MQPNPQGILFVGAHPLARALARALQQEGCPTLLVDSDAERIRLARMEGLRTYRGTVLAQRTFDAIDYGNLARLLAVSPDAATNSLACLRYREVFGRQEVYQLPCDGSGAADVAPDTFGGRVLFAPGHTYGYLESHCGSAPTIKKTRITATFRYPDLLATHEGRLIPLVALRPNGSLSVFTADHRSDPTAGDLVISLVCPHKAPAPAT